MTSTWLTVDQIKADRPYACVGGPFGSDLTTRDYTEDGIPVVRGNNLRSDRRFLDEDFVFISEQKAASLASNTACPGDLVFTQRGTLGQVALIPEQASFARYVISQSQMKLSVNTSLVLPEFVYYWFRQSAIVEVIKRRAISSGVPHINLGILKSLALRVPPLNEQREIVRIVEGLDNLIENNRRRIQLLERSARLLYREWFVHLRFPGHEHLKVVDGVPKGWDRVFLGDILTLQRGFDLPSGARRPGPVPIIASTGANGYHDKAMVRAPGVVTGRSGSLGTVMYVLNDFWPLNTTLWVKEFKRVSPVFACHLLEIMALQQYNGGAAVPTLNRNDVHRVEVLCPPGALIRSFDESVDPCYQQTKILNAQNEKLVQARDLLLPRLMSGEIEV